MEIRGWLTVDIYFNEDERAKAMELIKRYVELGYDNNGEDDGNESYSSCIQLISKINIVKGDKS